VIEPAQTTRRSTRQLLGKIPNFPGLYRHTINGIYYAIKKKSGKRKEHSLDTTDRKVAERRFKEWDANLDKVDTEVEKTTLAQLVEKFEKTRQGMTAKTKSTESWIIKMLKDDWAYDLDIRVWAALDIIIIVRGSNFIVFLMAQRLFRNQPAGIRGEVTK